MRFCRNNNPIEGKVPTSSVVVECKGCIVAVIENDGAVVGGIAIVERDECTAAAHLIPCRRFFDVRQL